MTEKRAASSFLTYKYMEETVPGRAAGGYGAKKRKRRNGKAQAMNFFKKHLLYAGLEKDEIKRFRKKVIPKAVIKKMEKQKEEMRIEERDRRAEELQNQMFAGIPTEEIVEEEPPRDEVELISEEPQAEEEPKELMAEEIIEEEVEEKPKEKTNKQASLFDF